MEEKGLIITAIVLVILLGISMIALVSNITVEAPEVDLSGLASVEDVALLSLQIQALEAANDGTTVDNSNEYILTKSEFEDESIENKALELASESVDSRDFKKAVFDALVSFGVDIDSYKDITEIDVLDVDVKKNNKVEFDVKVFYFIEDDESETYKSRLEEFKVTVDDLDFDDEFVDAEVDESYMDSLVVEYSRED